MRHPPEDVSQDSHLVWMLRQMVDQAATRRAELEAKKLLETKLQASDAYQSYLEQTTQWALKLVQETSDMAAGVGFYAVSIVLAVMLGVIVTINIPYLVVCGEIDPVCLLRLNGKTLEIGEVLEDGR